MSMTTEQMKQALAQAGVNPEVTKPASDFSTADVVAAIGSGAVWVSQGSGDTAEVKPYIRTRRVKAA